MKIMVLLVLVSLSAPSVAGADELLVNGGFETGDLTGWTAVWGEGHVVTESAVDTEECERIDPPTPRTGSYLFSSAVSDGATFGTEEITIKQVIDVSGYDYIAANRGFVFADGYVSGSPGCAKASDDRAELVLQFYQGGESGSLISYYGSGLLDPEPVAWRWIGILGLQVPPETDTIVFNYATWLDEGFASIDIGADDLSLDIEEGDTPVEKWSWGKVRAGYRE